MEIVFSAYRGSKTLYKHDFLYSDTTIFSGFSVCHIVFYGVEHIVQDEQ